MTSAFAAFGKHRIVLEFLEECAPNIDWAACITPNDVCHVTTDNFPAFILELLAPLRVREAANSVTAIFDQPCSQNTCFTVNFGDLSTVEQLEYVYERGERQKIELKKLRLLRKQMQEGILKYRRTGVLPLDVEKVIMNCDYCGTDHYGKPCPKRKREREEREIEHQRLEKELQQAYARSEEHRLKFIREQEERRGVHDEPAPARLKRLRQEWGM